MINSKSTTNMSLAKQKWKEVTINHVYHAFLKGEYDKIFPNQKAQGVQNRAIVEHPDLTDKSQNYKRALLLLNYRSPLLLRIPCSTVWYEVSSLEEYHLGELRIIGRCGWDDINDQNELLSVADRRSENIDSLPIEWNTPILWGHTKEGPFTILEGNHRLVAYASSNHRPQLHIPVYIGLSEDYCFWHLLDPVS
jgi:hypothetical protein